MMNALTGGLTLIRSKPTTSRSWYISRMHKGMIAITDTTSSTVLTVLAHNIKFATWIKYTLSDIGTKPGFCYQNHVADNIIQYMMECIKFVDNALCINNIRLNISNIF